MPDVGLTHIALPVTDLEASLQFYETYANMRVVHSGGNNPTPRVAWPGFRTEPDLLSSCCWKCQPSNTPCDRRLIWALLARRAKPWTASATWRGMPASYRKSPPIPVPPSAIGPSCKTPMATRWSCLLDKRCDSPSSTARGDVGKRRFLPRGGLHRSQTGGVHGLEATSPPHGMGISCSARLLVAVKS